jgi:hypothetical protein
MYIFFKITIVCHLLRPARKTSNENRKKKPSGKKTSKADERQTDDRMLGKIHCFFFRSPSGLSPSSSPKERARRDEMMISSTSSFLHTHHTAPVCYIFAESSLGRSAAVYLHGFFFLFSFFPNSL